MQTTVEGKLRFAGDKFPTNLEKERKNWILAILETIQLFLRTQKCVENISQATSR